MSIQPVTTSIILEERESASRGEVFKAIWDQKGLIEDRKYNLLKNGEIGVLSLAFAVFVTGVVFLSFYSCIAHDRLGTVPLKGILAFSLPAVGISLPLLITGILLRVKLHNYLKEEMKPDQIEKFLKYVKESSNKALEIINGNPRHFTVHQQKILERTLIILKKV